MPPGVTAYNSALLLLLAASSWTPSCAAAPWTGLLSRRFDLVLDYSPAPSPEDGPPASAGALRDPAYLPAQIGGIVGAYAFSLVLVAALLLAFSKRRRDHLRNRDRPLDEQGVFFEEFNPFTDPFLLQSEEDYKKQLEEFQQLGQIEHQQFQDPHFQQQQFQLYQFQQQQLEQQQFEQQQFQQQHLQQQHLQTLSLQIPTSPARNFSLPSASPLSPTRTGPLSPTKSQRSVFTASSPTSTILAPGIDLSVDQTVVGRDRIMAQQQLEEMYKYVMEQEQAKAEGREYQGPPIASPSSNTVNASPAKGLKKERNKPSNLNLERDEKGQSRSSSIFSFLKSPRKNKMGAAGMSISSPIMTPMSGTFPRHDDQEMNPISPRHYAPPPPPPVPSNDLPFRRAAASAAGSSQLPTPEMSPVSTQSIDSRIDAAIGQPPSRVARREQRERETRRSDRLPSHSRDVSSAATSIAGDNEPISASSEKSTSHLVGLPLSPRPGARFPSDISLPASPRPHQQSFHHPQNTNNSSTASFPRPSGGGGSTNAVREGGALPLRAYQPSVVSPTATSFATTKQTVFTRAAPGPLSPGGGMQTGMRTPWTGAPVPYTPYQPFSPVVPITPSVVTRADRKRMKRLEPKTPTVEMVRNEDEIW